MKAFSSFYLKIKNIFFSGGKGSVTDSRANLDRKLVYSLTKSRIPNFAQIKYLKKFLNPKEIWWIRLSFLVIIISLFFLGARFYTIHLATVSARGGEYSEALVGAPKHVNPLYSGFSDVDSDIARLIFSSLFKYNSDGQLVKDLADSYEISADGKTCVVKLKEGVKWHDGSTLTANDVIFTFNTLKNADYKSPLRATFAGVDIEKVDDETVKFDLSESYAPFTDLLTFGIMPQNLWSEVPAEGAELAELNLKPVGSGPYKFKSLSKDTLGQIKSYSLSANDDYYGGRPNIDTVTFKFFVSPEEAVQALNDNVVEGIGYLPKRLAAALTAKNSYQYYKLNLPELTAVFLNQKNNPLLSDVKVRQALAYAINKSSIVNDIFGGDARIIDGPILPENFAYNPDIHTYPYNQASAAQILDDAGWKVAEIIPADVVSLEQSKNKSKIKPEDENKLAMGAGRWRTKDNKFLTIKLTTVDTDENIQVAERIKQNWEALNIKVVLKTISASQIQNDVIRPRNFEALFYGQMVGNNADAYVFWHSSQVGDAGANLSDYSNKEVDQLLEDGRLTTSQDDRKTKYQRFQEIITDEVPAIFMYSPFYTYSQNKNIQGFNVSSIQIPADRFANISDWYTKTKRKIIW